MKKPTKKELNDAIREKCYDCNGTNPMRCTAVKCPLYPYRRRRGGNDGHPVAPKALAVLLAYHERRRNASAEALKSDGT